MDTNGAGISDLQTLILGLQSWNDHLSLHPVLVVPWAFGGSMHFQDAARSIALGGPIQCKEALNRHSFSIQVCPDVVPVTDIHSPVGLDGGLCNFRIQDQM